jgi:hypothetical protein
VYSLPDKRFLRIFSSPSCHKPTGKGPFLLWLCGAKKYEKRGEANIFFALYFSIQPWQGVERKQKPRTKHLSLMSGQNILKCVSGPLRFRPHESSHYRTLAIPIFLV